MISENFAVGAAALLAPVFLKVRQRHNDEIIQVTSLSVISLTFIARMDCAKNISAHYERRRPELTSCYRILQDHLDRFLADREADGRPLPDYVVSEFDAYLRCGIPAFGFLRLKCEACTEEKIVAFSCKKRGFCPSCCAKRMAEAAMHLEAHVLPYILYRQFVLSFPIPMRFWLQSNRKLYARIHKIVIKYIHNFYQKKAYLDGLKESMPGTISFTQRWGSALNLNPHMHVLAADGVYTRIKGAPRFNRVKDVTDQDIADLVADISKGVLRYLRQKGYLNADGDLVENPIADDLFQQNESLSLATQCSITSRIAFGPNAGKYVTRIGSGFGYSEEIPLAKGRLCYSVNGFSLHAATTIKTQQRDRLRKLIEYMARGPLSNERLEITSDGLVKLTLKSKWSDGTT